MSDRNSRTDDSSTHWTEASVAGLFEQLRPRLRRCVVQWLPVSVQQRFGADDVLQDAVLRAIQSVDRMATLRVEPFVWFRSLARESLTHKLRSTMDAARRTVFRETAMERPSIDSETSRKLAAALADSARSPSSALCLQESLDQMNNAIEQLTPADQQTLQLLFFEGLSVTEASQVLEISTASVSTRKLRALKHLREILGDDKSGSESPADKR